MGLAAAMGRHGDPLPRWREHYLESTGRMRFYCVEAPGADRNDVAGEAFCTACSRWCCRHCLLCDGRCFACSPAGHATTWEDEETLKIMLGLRAMSEGRPAAAEELAEGTEESPPKRRRCAESREVAPVESES